MKIKVIVRTWRSTRDESHPKGYCDKMFLKNVYLPINVIKQIDQWAKKFQIDLLDQKYKKQSLGFIEAQQQSCLVESNQLLAQFQQEGLDGDLELLAITFLIGQHRDNPESIDLAMTQDYLAKLEGDQAA